MNTDFSAAEMLKTIPARLSEKIESLGLPRKKALEYAGMFVALTVIYYCYYLRDWKQNTCRPETTVVTIPELGVLMLKFLAFTAWPFALMAGFDSTWRSKDAGNVFLAAYVAGNVWFYHRTHCGFCIFAAAFRIIPYVFCAWLAHGIGAWVHRIRRPE